MKSARLPEGWLTVVTLAVALVCAVASVVEAKWVDHIAILYTLVLAGLVVGIVASRIRVPTWVLHIGSSVIGLGAVVALAASTINRGDTLAEKFGVLVVRIATWIRVIQEGGFGTEPVLFLLVLAVGGWLVGYLSSWWVFRRHSAVFPLAASGAILVVNISYASETLAYVLPYAVASLLLVTRLNYYRQEATWLREGLRYDRAIWRATLPIGIAIGIVAAGFGWYAPEIPPRDDVNQLEYELQRPVKDFQWEFNRLFGGIRGRGGIVWAASVSGFGNSMNLSGQFRLADYEVLRIWSPQPLYWRAVVYDRYNGQGWTMNQPVSTTRLAAGDTRMAANEQFKDRIEVTQIVEVVQSRGDYLIGSSDPIRVDTPVVAESLIRPQRQIAEDARPVGEPLALRTPMMPGKTYQVTSSVSAAGADSLRLAGTNYPADIRSRYTRLPVIPQRVRDLATQLVAGKDNPYDQARAIESYLRTLPYSLDIAPPPPDRDGVDYFLFDVKAGYCDYYASAMAVMSRSVGIPARVVTGYATGSRDSADQPFVVRDSNAHTWVEIYFPQYGWVPFEPSGYRPAIEHVGLAQQDNSTVAEFANGVPVDSNYMSDDQLYGDPSAFGYIFEPSDGSGPFRVAGTFAGLVGLIAALAYLFWRLRLRGLAPVPATYARLVILASVLRSRPGASETPLGYARRLGDASPGIRANLARIADSYTRYRWAQRHDDGADASALASAWREVRHGLISAVPERLKRRLRDRS